MTRAVITLAALSALAFATGAARAERPEAHGKEAAVYFDRGALNYNLGHFQEATAAFEKAYEIEPSPILLFNIAQCQRQLGNNDRALFLYRRYLEQAPKAPNRADVTRRIAEIEQSIRDEKAAADARARASAEAAAVARKQQEVAAAERAPARAGWRGPWSAAALVAPAFVWFPRDDLDSATVFAARLEGAYGLPVRGGAVVRLGLDADFAYVPYDNLATSGREGSALWGLLATARYLRHVRPELALGAGVGVGLAWWAGLGAGNPFTRDETSSGGAVLMPTFELGVRGEYTLGRGLYAVLSPALVVSKTTGDALSSATSRVMRFDVTIGVGTTF
jgi:tetratricopeptide (TPR) repeat protein